MPPLMPNPLLLNNQFKAMSITSGMAPIQTYLNENCQRTSQNFSPLMEAQALNEMPRHLFHEKDQEEDNESFCREGEIVTEKDGQ
mmetsp:Transcript_42628/g.40918  ORF Transcript_42628/g.40918 Transcript_42628/m.40918 type:complete len:85 (-) Transcript_42628:25-279(-)